MTLVIILVLLIALTSFAYVTRRRFGVLGLALCAGLVLSQIATGDVVNVLRAGDVPVEPLTYQTASRMLLVLLPAVALLFSGPRYDTKHMRMLGALGFGVFATILVLPPLTADLPISDEAVRPILSAIASNSNIIIVIAVVVALIDTMYAHNKKSIGKKK